MEYTNEITYILKKTLHSFHFWQALTSICASDKRESTFMPHVFEEETMRQDQGEDPIYVLVRFSVQICSDFYLEQLMYTSIL